jgi:dissimilatory sulfite reductase (desulfoviridin) alpha/beta subunit
MTVSEDLSAVEAEHGFTFGDDGSTVGDVSPVVAVVVCTTPTCRQLNQHVQVHADHPTPVHCGGCFAVLHCEHELTDSVRHEGTLGAPVEVRESACVKCGHVAEAARKNVDPIPFDQLPVTVLAKLIADNG